MLVSGNRQVPAKLPRKARNRLVVPYSGVWSSSIHELKGRRASETKGDERSGGCHCTL